jgi:hypothetical protein
MDPSDMNEVADLPIQANGAGNLERRRRRIRPGLDGEHFMRRL